MRCSPILIILLILFSFSGSLQAQTDSNAMIIPDHGSLTDAWAIFHGAKMRFIQENLDLTSEEKKGFWPLFHEYEREKKEIMSSIMGGGPGKGKQRHLDRYTEEQIDSIITHRFIEEQELLNLKVKYYEMLKEVLPTKKIAQYYKIDEDFRRHLIERMKGKRGNNRGRGM